MGDFGSTEFWQAINGEQFVGGFVGGVFGTLAVLGIMFAILLALAVYIYVSYSWMVIGQKLKYKNSWLAWIPIVNISMILQLGGFHWAWVFLVLIPIVGWIALFVLMMIATWKIFEKRKYPGWFSLSLVIPQVGFILYLVAIGFVAYSDRDRKKEIKSKKKNQ